MNLILSLLLIVIALSGSILGLRGPAIYLILGLAIVLLAVHSLNQPVKHEIYKQDKE